jgi:hypothetical protein
MANVYAVKSGNWSDVTVWNTGALPTASDDVWANNFTVAANVTTIVLSIRNASTTGINAGGVFTAVNGVTLTCTGSGAISRGSGTSILTSSLTSGQSFSIIANIIPTTGSTSGDGTGAIWNTSSGIINITGTLFGSGGNNGGYAVANDSFGTINITGNILGGSGFNQTYWIATTVVNRSGGSINVTGNINAGTYGVAHGIDNRSTGTVNITGDVTGGSNNTSYGVNNASTGRVNITGTINAGSTALMFGVNNASSGILDHIGTAQASSVCAAIGTGSVSQRTILTGPLLCTADAVTGASAAGVNPCVALRWFPKNTALGTFIYRMKAEALSGTSRPDRQLYYPEYFDSSYPLSSNVRLDIGYGPGTPPIYSGTMAVPSSESVIFGVPIDNTVGSAEPNLDATEVWNFPIDSITTPGSIGEKLKQISTVGSVGDQIAAMKQAT